MEEIHPLSSSSRAFTAISNSIIYDVQEAIIATRNPDIGNSSVEIETIPDLSVQNFVSSFDNCDDGNNSTSDNGTPDSANPIVDNCIADHDYRVYWERGLNFEQYDDVIHFTLC
ncbi:hypothetical protein L1887_16262 [Cichorium endivia]|nr:hypothetical protein L1887_16262 [Cichorium endivia]